MIRKKTNKSKMLKSEIKKVLEEFRERVTSMGEFFDNKPIQEALTKILDLMRSIKSEV